MRVGKPGTSVEVISNIASVYSVSRARPAFPTGLTTTFFVGGGGGGQQASSSKHKLWNFHSFWLVHDELARGKQ